MTVVCGMMGNVDGVARCTRDIILGDDGVQKLSQGWGKDDKLTALDLSSQNIGVAGAKALASALRANLSITSVDCSRNGGLGDKGVALLTSTLLTDGTGASTIRELSLVRCAVGDPGAIALAQALRGNSVLDKLKLTGNFIGDTGAVALMNSLVSAGKSFLGELSLSRNCIGPVGAEGIAEALKKSPVLRELHLSGNDLGDMGVAALVRGAVTGESMQGIYLGGCGVGDMGAKELANVVGGSLHLEILCLGHNSIGDEGVSALACALSDNQSLRRLLLPANNMRAAGGKAVAGMLLSNHALFHLDVSGNRLGRTGIEAVASAITKNTTLLELNLSECAGTDDSFRAVAAALETNGTLACLIYDGNQLGVDTLTEIEFAMGRARRSVRVLVGQIQSSTDARDRLVRKKEKTADPSQTRNHAQGGSPSVRLAPGQETSVFVSFGGTDNVVGSITVTNETCLQEARELIDHILRPHHSPTCRDDQSKTGFRFYSNLGHVVPKEDEGARRVVWDCDVPVRLRPDTWVSIERA